MKPIGKMFILGIKIVFLKKIALVEDFWAILISIEHISKPQGRQKIIKSKRACPSIVITKNGLRHFTQLGYPVESSAHVGLLTPCWTHRLCQIAFSEQVAR